MSGDDERFEDRGEVARGGMGVVRRVHDRVLGRDVAMKIVDPSDEPTALESFLAEARVTGQLEHPNIVPVTTYPPERADALSSCS